MDQYYLVAIVAVLIAIAAIVMVLRGRAKPPEQMPAPPAEAAAPKVAAPAPTPPPIAPTAPAAPVAPAAAAAPAAEPHDRITDAAAVATIDVAGQFLGIDINPGPPDDLTRLKGLGPKAQGVLNGMGVTHFAQLAALSPAQVAKVDAAMGTFAGRINRDQWVEQAKFLASGDIPGFEAKFGKLG
ncbi:Predicted 5' DNA nuclease, flap endonuclease-1-like, helix-3-turn-helix (H3TH) domain [Sphingomonas laterariae]|uniref:Predicted 5' DNA nuclease, flap endonuclease-1-like, helix-3-turn-helix (H3TH) domain n=1 Tax=Edaphosphingomonas laterariae TaxID=861865 RepID=A0A239F6G2_9SPHN|nr:hypothetical protein [Sphingomonas laterariae]SNS52405.1 Predicted 5' DNA nuclease, flap endonuclease-1-like, helix-3-turn-helix (H3TH) domain [Sphingomonas laterariae]